ncbi:MAG: fused MFS/spermidine synthase [Acidimicrobiales bacterium]
MPLLRPSVPVPEGRRWGSPLASSPCRRPARILVFFTSASVLVLEILAGRLMAPYVGVSLETFTAIIGTILAGIAAGSAVGGRLADRFAPRRLIGPALVIGGALAWWSLWIVAVLGPEFGNRPVAIVLLATLAFFAPAAVLSAVTPMATKLRLASLDETGKVVGNLSAAGTAGALFGTFVTGFVLIAAMPTRPIMVLLGGALVLTGLGFMLTADRRAPTVALVVPLLASLGAGVSAHDPCEFESAYFCGRVVTDPAEPSVRYLILDTLRHAAVDLDDPTNLKFRYIRLFADVIDSTSTGPVTALHLGGGGFTMPRWLAATRPGSRSVVLEIDKKLVEVNRDQLGLVTGPDLEVRIGDARLAMDDLVDGSFDVVIGDAFGGQAVPWHLTTTEFIAEIDRVLTDDGIYVMNLIDGDANRFAEWELATLRANFDHVAVIVPVGGLIGGEFNEILVASDTPIPAISVDPADGIVISDGGELDRFQDDGRVLRDDYAPVEQLSANPD